MFATLLSVVALIDDVPAISVDELVRTYQTNAARADERFTDRPVTVFGKVQQITRGGLHVAADKSRQTYHLWMTTKADGVRVCFRFMEAERSGLAKLEIGQEVWIQGRPNGVMATDGLCVFDCSLVPADRLPVVEPPKK